MSTPDPVSESAPTVDLLIDWEGQRERRPLWVPAVLSLLTHVFLFVFFRTLPDLPVRQYTTPPTPSAAEMKAKAIPLMLPPDVMTQKAPNKQKPTKEFDLEGLVAPKTERVQEKAGTVARPAPKPMSMPGPEKAQVQAPPKVLTPAPEIAERQQNALPQLGNSLEGIQARPPQPSPEPEKKPKLTFESIGSNQGGGSGANSGVKIQAPKTTVAEAVQAVARNRTQGGLVVSDMGDVGGITPAPNTQPSQGKTGSQIELLSDPQGVDFRPYLIQVLAAVRRNWFAVIPESARLGGRPGRVSVQFAISKNGSVPKLVIAGGSGTESFDRAAVAGISASNPFPPLPSEFRGDQVRLQLVFNYNMPAR
ncbi:MAG: TonB family protein [Bryobacteraceae bacterium]|nr:TonB family protein [Bryobacteraceae bacterium]